MGRILDWQKEWQGIVGKKDLRGRLFIENPILRWFISCGEAL